MQVVDSVVVPFILELLSQGRDQASQSKLISLFREVCYEMMEKVRDIYCVLPSLLLL